VDGIGVSTVGRSEIPSSRGDAAAHGRCRAWSNKSPVLRVNGSWMSSWISGAGLPRITFGFSGLTVQLAVELRKPECGIPR
jgi:hypothetical protein